MSRFGEDLRNDAALVRHAQSALNTFFFENAGHDILIGWSAAFR